MRTRRPSPRLGPPFQAGQPRLLLLPDCFRTSFFDLADSMGHSRFVLRILICLSQRLRPQQTFHRTRRRPPRHGPPSEVAWPPEEYTPRGGCDIPIAFPDALSDVIRDTQDG